ncbi:GTPase-activating protein gyp8 [Thecaphora frezii]
MSLLNDLRRRSLLRGGFDRDFDGLLSPAFRKAAWLYLLHVTDDVVVEDVPASTASTVIPSIPSIPSFPSFPAIPASDGPSDSANGISLVNHAEADSAYAYSHAPSSASSSSRTRSNSKSDTLDGSIHQPFSTPATSPRPDLIHEGERIPLDKDGWQIAPLEALRIDETKPSASVQRDEEWKTVTSKRTRALQRRRGSAAAHSSVAEGQTAQPTSEEPRLSATGPSSQAGSNAKGRAARPQSSSGIGGAKSSSSNNNNNSKKVGKRKKKGKTAAVEGANHVEVYRQHKDASAREPRSLASPLDRLAPHRDEEQVDKDIRRSFVGPTYASQTAEERLTRRRQLEEVVLLTLRRYPSLCYYQGYHDVVSVLVDTLAATPEASSAAPQLWRSEDEAEQVRLATERMSLHFVRDSMARDLDPIMGQLKLVRNLVRAEDGELARRVEQASAMPFFALSWLLTLFAHDVEGKRAVERCFDFVLAHGPESVVYLCAAVVVTIQAEELERLSVEELEDPAMLHLVLSRLPRFSVDDDDDDGEGGERGAVGQGPWDGDGDEEAQREEAMFGDPDVHPPSTRESGATPGRGTPKSLRKLLIKAEELMCTYPLAESAALGASRVMGQGSVVFTWSRLVASRLEQGRTTEDETQTRWWAAQNDVAQQTVVDVSAIVRDPHPSPPPSLPDGEGGGGAGEKTQDKRGRKRYRLAKYHGGKGAGAAGREVAIGTILAVVGVAGVVMALYEARERGQVTQVWGMVGGVVAWLGQGR